MYSRILAISGMAVSLLWPAFAYAAGEELVGLWKAQTSFHPGTLEIKNDGTFVRQDGERHLYGAWVVNPNGSLLYTIGQHQNFGACNSFSVAAGRLTITHCSQARNAMEGLYLEVAK